MGVQQDRARRDDQALEEVRRLFARYRRIARQGPVKERDQRGEKDPRVATIAGAPAPPARARDS